MMLRAALCVLALGIDTTGAFHAAPQAAKGWTRTTELQSTNDLYMPQPTVEVCLVPSRNTTAARAHSLYICTESIELSVAVFSAHILPSP